MSKIAFLLTLPVTVFVGLLPAAPAQALVTSTFVSAAGSDSNNCANVATPCRHLATAYAATAPNGEIYVLDPANYGSLTITGPVSIEGHGWASIAPVSGQAAITINANTGDNINIIGVVLDGTAIASSYGITFNSGGSLTVRDSVIRNFTAPGIYFKPNNTTSLLVVSNTLVSDNGNNGIAITPLGSGSAAGVLDHVTMHNNLFNGVQLQPNVAGEAINFTITDSVSTNNAQNGVLAEAFPGAPVNVVVRNSTIANNGQDGLLAENSGATILVTRSTITNNATAGWAVSSSGVVSSYVDNNIDGNGGANSTPTSTLVYH